MIAVVDYGRGNIFSLGQALRHAGVEFNIVHDSAELRGADKVILPGVGAFGDAMQNLRERNLVQAINECASRGSILVGICLGMQLLADWSDEFGRHQGLGLIGGGVQRLPPGEERIPNVGWRNVTATSEKSPAGEFAPRYFYFVHSYHFVCDDPAHMASQIEVNGSPVAAIVWKDNLRGTQFHPEKSGANGLKLLERLLKD